MSWRSPFEDRIAEWVESEGAGPLPGSGRPLDLDDYFATPESLRAGYALLKGNGFCPAEVELLRQINRLEKGAANTRNDEVETYRRRELTEAMARLGWARGR